VSAAVLSVGSNLGDRLDHLAAALRAVARATGGPVAVSAVYETAPWGPVPQPAYLNAVLVADDPERDARGWLAVAHGCERAAGRLRDVRWGARTLDVDVVQVVDTAGPVRSDDPLLTLPHPRAHERGFVLVPWLDVQPDAVLAGRGPVAALVDGLPPAERDGVRRRDDLALATPAGRGEATAE
jgi:2-amino-4-hydroxy-6-hydroxymethyldihydropteridine diphosphokinase